MSLKCPLCGKIKTEESLFCEDCTVKINSEYEVNVPASENSQTNTVNSEIKPAQENIKEEPEQVLAPLSYDKKAWKKKKEDKRSASDKSYYEIARDKKINKGRYIMIALFILVAALIAGLYIYNKDVKSGNLERSKWEVAQRVNTVDSYLTYMDEYPQGDYMNEAYNKMLSLKNEETESWQNLMTSESTLEFTTFLEQYPESPYQRKVKSRLDSLVWQSTLKENSSQGYSDYIKRSTLGEISGDYIGEAQKRLNMLDQSTPIDEVEMEQIRETVNGFFAGLSNLSHAELSHNLAPVIVRFNNSTNMQRDKVIGELLLMAAKSDARTLRFEPEIMKLKYERMGNGAYQANIPLQKIIEGNNGGINQIKGYIVHLKLDHSFKIYSFYETKPFPTAP